MRCYSFSLAAFCRRMLSSFSFPPRLALPCNPSQVCIFYQAGKSKAPGSTRAFNRARSPRKMWLQAWVASLFPAQPSLGLRQSRRYLLLNPSIVPARQRVCSPLQHAQEIRPPFLRPYKLMPPSCHLPSPPGVEGAQPHPRVKPRAVAPAGAAASTDGLLFPAQLSLRLR